MLTRATQQKRLKRLEESIRLAADAYGQHLKRAAAAEERVARLTEERDWLAQAPVSDPEDEAGGGEG